MNVSTLRDTIVEKLRGQELFKDIVTADINGNYFSAVDIALTEGNGENKTYRIAVIQHNPQKRFT